MKQLTWCLPTSVERYGVMRGVPSPDRADAMVHAFTVIIPQFGRRRSGYDDLFSGMMILPKQVEQSVECLYLEEGEGFNAP